MMTKEDLSDRFWMTQSRLMASSYQQPGQENEEGSAMAALMRSTDDEIETNCRLVRDVIESQKEQKEKKF